MRLLDASQEKAVMDIASTVATSALTEPLSGLSGLAAGVFTNDSWEARVEAAANAVDMFQQTYGRTPTTEEGIEVFNALGELTAPITQGIERASDSMFERTGSPAAAAMMRTLPEAVAAGFAPLKIPKLPELRTAGQAVAPDGTMFNVTETPEPTGKSFDSTPKTPVAVIPGKQGDYSKDRFMLVESTDDVFKGTDIGEGVVENAQIGVGEKGPYLNVGDVLQQNLNLAEYKRSAQTVKTSNQNMHTIKINLRKKSSFGNGAFLGGVPPKGLDGKPLISIETTVKRGDGKQHFYAKNVNLTGNSYLAKYPQKENPRLKVEQVGQVFIDTSPSNIVGWIKKGNPSQRGSISADTANIKVVDGEYYVPIYREVWTEGFDLGKQ